MGTSENRTHSRNARRRFSFRLLPVFRFVVLLFCLLLASVQQSFAQEKTETPAYHFRFKSVPRHLLGDVQHSFWGVNGLFFLLGTGYALSFLPVDHAASRHFIQHPVFSKGFDNNFGIVLSPYTLGGASLVSFIVGTQVDDPKFALASESMLESWLLSMGLIGGAKLAVGRTRPNGGKHSRPSAHAGAAFSMAAVLADFYGVMAAIPAFALASLVAFSRLDGGYHYVSDVLVGAVVGTAIGLGTSEYHKKGYPQFFILPQVSADAVGLAYYKTF